MNPEVDQTLELYLRRDYENEIFWKKFLNICSVIAIFGTSILFLVILFSQGYLADTRLILIMYWGYFTSLSSILLIPYYRIPRLILELANPHNSNIAWNIILSNPRYYIQPVFNSYKLDLPSGMDFSPENFCVTKEWILNQFHIPNRFPWKKIGRWYFVVYLVVSFGVWMVIV